MGYCILLAKVTLKSKQIEADKETGKLGRVSGSAKPRVSFETLK